MKYKEQHFINHYLYLSLSQSDPTYSDCMSACHQRAADRIVYGAMANGGLYIKLGQGLGSFNQILPREYIETLKVLLNKVREVDALYQSGRPCN